MILPELLIPGDKIGIVAPARKINKSDIELADNILSAWGAEVVLSRHLYSSRNSYLSGTDEERLSDFQSMVNSSSIRAILCARGGYGCTRIVDEIDFSLLRSNPKWIIGFSDVTALHLKLLSLGIGSVHGIMPVLFGKMDSIPSIESLRTILTLGNCEISSSPSPFNKTGRARGQVIGGNLSLIVDSLGTSSEPDTTNKILVIEEIDEYLYKLDRMMTQLKRAGKLTNLSGLVVGHMTDIKDTDLNFGHTVHDIILNAVKNYNYPVAFGFPSGHENPNFAWIHGGFASLTVDNFGVTLAFEPLKKRTE